MTKSNSSTSTVFTLVNSMIGGAMLTFPVLFRNSGLLTSIIVLFVSGFISYKTCRIYVIHLSEGDEDVEVTIRRILGKKW
jgi:amino acid permease